MRTKAWIASTWCRSTGPKPSHGACGDSCSTRSAPSQSKGWCVALAPSRPSSIGHPSSSSGRDASGPDRVRSLVPWPTGGSSGTYALGAPPTDDARGWWRVRCPAGSQPDVGAPELAELLRPDAIRLAIPPGGGARGARRRAADAGRARGGDDGSPPFRHLGFAFPEHARNAAEAVGLQGVTTSRPAP